MEKKTLQTHNFQLKNFKDVYDYCFLNGIMDINSFIERCFKKGFDIEKYGLLGGNSQIVEKEIIKEIKVEVPIEKIVEVVKYVDREIVKEIPVEKIVTKVDNISYENEKNELLLKIQQLETINNELVISTKKVVVETKDDEKLKMLQTTLQSLKKQLSLRDERIKELEDKIKELENLKINQGAVFMKNSNLSNNL